MNPEPRVQKALAHAGLGSRRELEEKIRAGRIRMDGRVVQLGDRVIPGATLEMDGKPLRPLSLPAARVIAPAQAGGCAVFASVHGHTPHGI